MIFLPLRRLRLQALPEPAPAPALNPHWIAQAEPPAAAAAPEPQSALLPAELPKTASEMPLKVGFMGLPAPHAPSLR